MISQSQSAVNWPMDAPAITRRSRASDQERRTCQRTHEANGTSGLQVVAVTIEEPADVVGADATQYGLSHPIALDPTAAAFRRRDGLIRHRWFGPLSLAEMQRRIGPISAA